jgi:hypothetical protein
MFLCLVISYLLVCVGRVNGDVTKCFPSDYSSSPGTSKKKVLLLMPGIQHVMSFLLSCKFLLY